MAKVMECHSCSRTLLDGKVGRAGHRRIGGSFLRAVRVTKKLASKGELNCHVARCELRIKSRRNNSTDKMEFQKAKYGKRYNSGNL